MPRVQKKFHYIYKTTCNVTKRFYYGMHSTDNLEDGYLGSGQRLWKSINKHGKENHSIEILEYLENRSSLKDREKELITEELLKDPMCMNLQLGGGGGFIGEEHRKKTSDLGTLAFQKKIKKDDEFRKYFKSKCSKRAKEMYKKGLSKKWKCDWTGRKHSEETKAKLRHHKNIGENNPQYGTCWITNEKENKKIPRGSDIPGGWRLGRKIKWRRTQVGEGVTLLT